MKSFYPQMSVWLQSRPKVAPTTRRVLSHATDDQKSVWRFNLTDSSLKSGITNGEYTTSAFTRSGNATTTKMESMRFDSTTTIIKEEKESKVSRRRRLGAYLTCANCMSCLIPFLQGLIIGVLVGGVILAITLPLLFLTGKSTTTTTAVVQTLISTIGTGTTVTTAKITTISTTTTTTSCGGPTSNSLLNFNPANNFQLYTVNFVATKSSHSFAIGVNTPSSGAIFMDDISIVDVAAPSVQLIRNGGFQNSTTTWTFWNLICVSSCSTAGDGGTIVTSGCGGNGNNCFQGTCTGAQLFLQQTFSATIGNTYQIKINAVKTGSGGTVNTYVY